MDDSIITKIQRTSTTTRNNAAAFFMVENYS